MWYVSVMLEATVAIGIAGITAMAALTQRLHNRITYLDDRIDKIELRVAEDYVSKRDLNVMMDKMETHMLRIEDKLDAIAGLK